MFKSKVFPVLAGSVVAFLAGSAFAADSTTSTVSFSSLLDAVNFDSVTEAIIGIGAMLIMVSIAIFGVKKINSIVSR